MSNVGDIIGEDFIARRNYANLLTGRAFTKALRLHPDRIALLMRITKRSQSTCYQYTQPIRPRKKGAAVTGSGIPSPLHQHCESVKRLVLIERAEGFAGISFSYEMARYPLDYWERLHRDAPRGEVGNKMVLLLRETAMANFKLGGRSDLRSLPTVEKRELHELLLNAKTLIGELEWMVGEDIGEAVAEYSGSPMPKDRTTEAALSAP